MKEIARFTPLMMIGLFSVSVLSAQGLRESDSVPLKNWDAPMYWQPSAAESKDAAAKQLLAGNSSVDRASSITAQAQTPANSLVFVGMTPCRVVDTRGGTGAFGGPNLIGGTSRTFPIQSSATCSIPPIAQAYSFNITLVTTSFVDFITVWPTGQARPNASTLNGYVNTVIANAAVVPAGTSGSVDVYASQNTHLIIDINGYYAQQTGITLAQGTAGTPSLSFAGDPATGIFSSGTGTLNIATAGTNRLSMASNGNLSLTGNLGVSGNGTIGGSLSVGTTTSPVAPLHVTGSSWFQGDTTPLPASAGKGIVIGFGGEQGYISGFDYGTFTPKNLLLNLSGGNVGIGTTSPVARLHVEGGSSGTGVYSSSGGTGVYGNSSSGDNPGVHGNSPNIGVYGTGTHGVYGISNGSGSGVIGYSSTGNGVYGTTDTGYAGFFSGTVLVTGLVYIPSLGSAGSTTLCRNASNQISTCSSSLRYKSNISRFSSGLDLVRHLRPVSFNWKEGGMPDFGLVAEDVAKVEPLLVTKNEDGQIEGVKYDRLSVVLVNAVQEQQLQIETQQSQIKAQQKYLVERNELLERQQRQIDSLKLLVCLGHPDSVVCN